MPDATDLSWPPRDPSFVVLDTRDRVWRWDPSAAAWCCAQLGEAAGTIAVLARATGLPFRVYGPATHATDLKAEPALIRAAREIVAAQDRRHGLSDRDRETDDRYAAANAPEIARLLLHLVEP